MKFSRQRYLKSKARACKELQRHIVKFQMKWGAIEAQRQFAKFILKVWPDEK